MAANDLPTKEEIDNAEPEDGVFIDGLESAELDEADPGREMGQEA